MAESALWDGIVSQFGHPRGPLGWLAGRIMLGRGSNRERTRWAISLLAPAAGDRILEIGFGPGYSTQLLLQNVTDGLVAGIDHSALMVSAARRRVAGYDQLVDLRCASVADLPAFGAPFDKVLAINSLQFWPEPAVNLSAIRKQMRPGATIALVVQPRSRRATAATSQDIAAKMAGYLDSAGFSDVAIHCSETLKPVPAAAALGTAP